MDGTPLTRFGTLRCTRVFIDFSPWQVMIAIHRFNGMLFPNRILRNFSCNLITWPYNCHSLVFITDGILSGPKETN